MLEDNERAPVSRLLLPALSRDWNDRKPAFADSWRRALEEIKSDHIAGLDRLESLVGELPAEISLAELERSNPEVVRECRRQFPTLVEARRRRPLKLRNRALHHIAETRRVLCAVRSLHELSDDNDIAVGSAMRDLGALINDSHSSLRDL